jgi:hypothetical protein
MAAHITVVSTRHRPTPPPSLTSLLSTDYIPKGFKSIPLPQIMKPPVPMPEGVPVEEAQVSKQHFEVVLWLAVFACTRESPHRAVVAMDVPRVGASVADGAGFASSAGLLRQSSPASRSGSPGGLNSFAAPPPAAVGHPGRSASPLPLTNHSMASLPPYSSGGSERGGKFDVGEDAESEVESSALTTVFADAPLTVSVLQCQTILRCLRVALGLQGGAGAGGGKTDQIGFTADSLCRWLAAPQQFGGSIKRSEDVLMKPPQQRRRRDAAYRNMITRLLADPLAVSYLWWCAGQYDDVYRGTTFPLFEEHQPLVVQSLSSSASTPKGDNASVAGGLRRQHTATSVGHYAPLPDTPSLADLQRSDERRDALELVTQLLWRYIDGAMEWRERDTVIAAASTVNKSLYISGMASPSLPHILQRSPSSKLNITLLTSVALVRCGLCDVAGIECCISLQILRLHGNRISALPQGLWTGLAQLREFDVSANLLPCLGFEIVLSHSLADRTAPNGWSSPPAGLTHLETLCAAFNMLADNAVAAWWDAPPPLFPALTHLDLSGNTQLNLFHMTRQHVEFSAPCLKRFVLLQTSVRAPAGARPSEGTAHGNQRHVDIVFPAPMPTWKYLVPAGGSRRQWRSLRSALAHVMNIVFLFREARRISTAKRIAVQVASLMSAAAAESTSQPLIETFSTVTSNAVRLRIRNRCNRVLRFHECPLSEQFDPAPLCDAQGLSASTVANGCDVSPSLSRVLGKKRMSSLRMGGSGESMRK